MRKRDDRAWWRWVQLRGERRISIVLVLGGVKSTQTLPSGATEREASRHVRILTAQLESGRADAPADWDEAIDQFIESRTGRRSTLASYRNNLRSVARTLPTSDPLALTESHAAAFVAARAGAVSASTIKGAIDAVAIMQRWCVAQGWLDRATWDEVERPEVIAAARHLRPDQLGAFLRASERLGKRDGWEQWPAAAYLLCHGLRTAEVQHLLVADIDLVSGFVSVVDRLGARTKTRASIRTIPIVSAAALECLRETYRDAAPTWPAFPTGRQASGSDVPVMASGRTAWFARRCRATCAEAEITPAVSPHDLRHTVATAAVIAGADMHSVQSLLGHSDARVTARIYSHATSAQRAQGAAEIVGAWLDRVVAPKPGLRAV
jgi:site-specific recombinase XerD